jgi:hypothetical protein
MGLTIHYSLKTDPLPTDEARKLVEQLRTFAGDLPFDEVGELVDGEESRSSVKQKVNAYTGMVLARTERPFSFRLDGQDFGRFLRPSSIFAFSINPGEGCEQACFGLGLYPDEIECQGQKVSTGLNGWRWWSFCKTQYASNARSGGLGNFLRCHVGIITLLDRAKELGILESVTDESGYWEKRNVPELVKKIGQWNSLVAGLVGSLQDRLEKAGVNRRQLMSEITKFPDFEHLEAKGRTDSDEEV